jgi:N-acetylglutamate synthase
MADSLHFALCDLGVEDYPEILALWQQAGLHVRPEGRDGPEAFARQLALGYQRVIGLRAVPAATTTSGSAGKGPDVQADASHSPAPDPTEAPLVAVAVLTHDGRKGWINRLAVSPAYRRRGLAQILIAEAERWFVADCGLEVWAALIESWNQSSRALFASLDYQPYEVVYVSKRTRPDA